MKRLFAAIHIVPGESYLALYHQTLRLFGQDRIRWVEPDNLHITLKFFGETETDRIPNIVEVIDAATGGYEPFSIVLSQFGLFGSRYNPRVIWVGIDEDEVLISLAGDLHKKLEEIGFVPERQNFRPHLTVGRIKKIHHLPTFMKNFEKLKAFEFAQPVQVEKIELLESILSKKGPEYKPVQRFILHG